MRPQWGRQERVSKPSSPMEERGGHTFQNLTSSFLLCSMKKTGYLFPSFPGPRADRWVISHLAAGVFPELSSRAAGPQRTDPSLLDPVPCFPKGVRALASGPCRARQVVRRSVGLSVHDSYPRLLPEWSWGAHSAPSSGGREVGEPMLQRKACAWGQPTS